MVICGILLNMELETARLKIKGRTKNKTNQRFGRLIALYPVRMKNRLGWFCQCDCGNTTVVQSWSLVSGGTRSCGCIRKETTADKNRKGFLGYEGLSGARFGIIRYNAKKRNIKFEITVKEAWELFLKQDQKCALSGLELCFGSKRKKIEQTASLDRINSELGYVAGNVQWIHKVINLMKGNQTQSSFIKMCDLISNYNKK